MEQEMKKEKLREYLVCRGAAGAQMRGGPAVAQPGPGGGARPVQPAEGDGDGDRRRV